MVLNEKDHDSFTAVSISNIFRRINPMQQEFLLSLLCEHKVTLPEKIAT